jgi:trans-aconitate methyltransferase
VLGLFEYSERSRERRHAKRPEIVTTELLRLAHLSSTDVVYDLECGDGGVAVAAARQFGAKAACFDIYPRRLAEARRRADDAHVGHLITFQQRYWDSVDVGPASVVVLWLTYPTGHTDTYKLRGQLTRELRPGARIVGYWRDLGDWQPRAESTVRASATAPASTVRLWIADGLVRP